MHERDAFLRMICERPDDATVRLVFADWLEEHGEATLACSLRSHVVRRLVGVDPTLRAFWNVQLGDRPGLRWTDFDCGFPHTLAVGGSEGLRALAELSQQRADRLPIVALSLNLGSESYSSRPAPMLRFPVEKLPSLRQLHIDWLDAYSWQTDPPLDYLCRWLARSPALETISQLSAGHLRGWPLRSEGEALGELLGSPHLRQLRELTLASLQYRDEVVAPILSARGLSGVVNLDLSRNQLEDHGAELIAQSPYLGELRGLNLRDNGIRRAGARALTRSRLAGTLEVLDLRGNPVSRRGRDMLRETFGERVLMD